MTTDAFLVCPQHGDIAWQQGARWGDPCETVNLTVVHPTLVKRDWRPVNGERRLCPICGLGLYDEMRPSVRRLKDTPSRDEAGLAEGEDAAQA